MRPTLDDIFYAVLEAFDIDDETYRNIKDSRESLAVSVRQVICWIGQNTYGYSQNKIGLYLGLNHSTVWHNKMKAQDYMSYDKDYKMCVYKALTILYAKEEEGGQKECSISGWVVRDEDGDLTVFSDKPIRETFSDGISFWCGEEPRGLDPSLFPQITWESEPQECEMNLRLK
jgi:hypothetical protein